MIFCSTGWLSGTERVKLMALDAAVGRPNDLLINTFPVLLLRQLALEFLPTYFRCMCIILMTASAFFPFFSHWRTPQTLKPTTRRTTATTTATTSMMTALDFAENVKDNIAGALGYFFYLLLYFLVIAGRHSPRKGGISGAGTTSMIGGFCVSLDRKLLRQCSRKFCRLHARGLIIGSTNWLDDGSIAYAIKSTDKCKIVEKLTGSIVKIKSKFKSILYCKITLLKVYIVIRLDASIY